MIKQTEFEKQKKVAVILSTYNGEEYLEEQINSVLNQKNVTVKIFARDDNSTDKSLEILKGYGNRICILPSMESNSGSTASYQDILRFALKDKYEFNYFAYCDQDDIWLPNNLYPKIEIIANETDPALSYSIQEYFQDEIGLYPSKKKDLANVNDNPFFQNPIRGCTMLFNRELAIKLAEYDPTKLVKHDFSAYICARLYGKIHFIPEIGMRYRIHKENETGIKKNGKDKFRNIAQYDKSLLVRQVIEICSHHESKSNMWIVKSGEGIVNLKSLSLVKRWTYINSFKRLRVSYFENFIVKLLFVIKKFPF
jgi:glycosyltransferase involved in cell wall biosynthesis